MEALIQAVAPPRGSRALPSPAARADYWRRWPPRSSPGSPASSGAACRVVLGIALLAGLVAVLAGHRAAFVGAVRNVSWASLVVAVLLHLATVVARSEAWATSVDAAGVRL